MQLLCVHNFRVHSIDLRFYTHEYFRFNLQMCSKAWLDYNYIENCALNYDLYFRIKKRCESIQKCMILKNGQQLLFVANGLVFTKGKCILRVPEIIQKTMAQSQFRLNNCRLI